MIEDEVKNQAACSILRMQIYTYAEQLFFQKNKCEDYELLKDILKKLYKALGDH